MCSICFLVPRFHKSKPTGYASGDQVVPRAEVAGVGFRCLTCRVIQVQAFKRVTDGKPGTKVEECFYYSEFVFQDFCEPLLFRGQEQRLAEVILCSSEF